MNQIVAYELTVHWDAEPLDLDREPDDRLVAPESGVYAVEVAADRTARLVRVAMGVPSVG